MNENNVEKILNEISILRNTIANAILYKRVPVVLSDRAVEKSADYAEKNMQNAIFMTTNLRSDIWDCAINKLKIDGHIAEFGVFQGGSINYLADLVYPKKIFGFDSFFGLEEDFMLDYPKGGFSLNGVPPKVKENVVLVNGSFSNSLPNWLNNNPGVFSFLNIDCDTYEATSTVLNCIGPEKIIPGTLILFDEYFGYHGWENGEFKAWKEYCNKNNIKYKYVATCHLQVLIEVLP
jgi:hypothetical protein